MATLSFKDVGVKYPVQKNVQDRTTVRLPIGIKTPLEIDYSGDSLFKTHSILKDQIADNLKNLILTNHGERVMQYDLGANLRPLVTEYSTQDDFDQEAMLRINTAITKFMPFVIPIGFESKPNYEENQYTGIIDIMITYSVPSINLDQARIDVRLYVA